MKRVAFSLLLLCAVAAFAAEASLELFTAKSDGKSISVHWRTSSEADVRSFELERASDGQTFRFVKSFLPTGGGSEYSYIDEEAFMKGDGEKQILASSYSYRLRIVGKSNTVVYSNQTTVAHTVSGVRRTWGMIKEMFR